MNLGCTEESFIILQHCRSPYTHELTQKTQTLPLLPHRYKVSHSLFSRLGFDTVGTLMEIYLLFKQNSKLESMAVL